MKALPVVALVLAMLLLYVPPATFRGESVCGADYLVFHQFRLDFAKGELAAGEWPSWYPRVFLGAPFAANVQSFSLLPTHLLLLLVPVEHAFGASVALGAVLAALAAYLLARTLGLSPWAAAASGFTFGASGFFAARVEVGHMPLLESFHALPLLLALVERAIASGGRGRDLVLLALAVLSATLSGHPQLPAYAVASSIAWAALRARGSLRLVLLGTIACGVVMSAFVWLPASGLLTRSSRRFATGGSPTDIALDAGRALALLLPGRDGVPGTSQPFTGPVPATFWDTTAYVGLLALLAVPLAVRKGDARVRGLLLLGAVALLLAFVPSRLDGGALAAVWPGRVFHSPSRLLYVTTCALSLGLGAALDVVTAAAVKGRGRSAIGVAAALGGVAGVLLARDPITRALVIAGAGAAIAVAGGARGPLVLACLVVLHAVDLGSWSRTFIETRDTRALYAVEEGTHAFLGRELGAGRVVILSSRLDAQNLVRHHDRPCGYDPLILERTMRGLEAISGRPLGDQESVPDAILPLEAMQRLGVKFVVADEAALVDSRLVPRTVSRGLRVLEVPGAAPRYSVRGGDVRVIERRAKAVTLRVSSPVASKLEVVEAFDPGWHASVDERQVAVEALEGYLMAVPVPAGEHEVRLVHRAPRVLAGVVTSLAGALGVALLAWRLGRRQI